MGASYFISYLNCEREEGNGSDFMISVSTYLFVIDSGLVGRAD